MALTTRKRKALFGLGIFLLLVAAIILSLPLWLPWALRPALQKYEVVFGSYQRVGYGRLILNDVVYTKNGTKFTARSVELFQPTVWLWKKQFASPPPANFVKVSNWQLEITKSDQPKKKKQSLYTLSEQIDKFSPRLEAWLPTATFTNGELRFGKESISLPSITWNRGLLKATASSERHKQNGELEMWFSTEPKRISVNLDQAQVNAGVEIRREGSSVKVQGDGAWGKNQITLSAQFGKEDWTPESGSINAPDFRIPAALLKLKQYEDLTGLLSGTWDGKKFSLDLDANAKPQARGFPPVRAVIHARGDTNVIELEKVALSAPWLQATLSENVKFTFAGKLLTPEAALKVEADLSQQELFEATGRLTGDVVLRRSEKKYPQADFKLATADFAGFDVVVKDLKLAGRFDWPMLELTDASARLTNGAFAEIKGKADLAAKTIQNGGVKLSGHIGNGFVPASVSYTNIAINAELSGPFKQLKHSGTAKIEGVTVPKLSPLALAAEWRGKFLDFEKLQVKATARRSSLTMAGAGNFSTNRIAFKLDTLTMTKLGQAFLVLKEPAQLLAEKVASKPEARWNVALDRVNWQGADREIVLQANINMPSKARIGASIRQMNSFVFQDFFVERLPNLKIENLVFAGGWTNGPLDFILRGQGEFRADETNVFSAQMNVSGDNKGISFENLKVLSESGPVISGRGFLPIRINPASRTNRTELMEKQIIDFRADSVPNKIFWERIAEFTKVHFDEPEVHFIFSGSVEKPIGKITAKAAGATWVGKKTKQSLPSLKNIEADIDLNEEKLRLNKLQLLLEGQPLSAEGELPLGKDFPKNLKKAFHFEKASGRIVADKVELAPFARFASQVLAPQGKLSLDLTIKPGLQMDGSLTLEDAATRPFSGSSSIHDLRAKLRFIERRIEFEDVQGLLGGQPIGIFGTVDFAAKRSGVSPSLKKSLSEKNADKLAALPIFHLRLKGLNVPLARTPEVIVRSDLDLVLSNQTNEVPLVYGNVNLRDSFYLGDIKQLLPGKVRSAQRRPPYFSIEAQPFADWRLRVKVTGKDFIKMRSPLFKGSASADFNLRGTLREPIALGDAKVESGVIQFPFANFKTTQGFVSLTSEDPYRPTLFVAATSRAFGHDLQMNLRGPGDAPIIEFTSTPSLTSEQIILMITAGEIPRKDFGYSSQQKAQKLAMFLGKGLLSKFASDEGGAERLVMSSGEDISESGRETYSLEYKLSEKWSLVGEYDRYGALNAGVKWKVLSK